jgi:hypothetical protein
MNKREQVPLEKREKRNRKKVSGERRDAVGRAGMQTNEKRGEDKD